MRSKVLFSPFIRPAKVKPIRKLEEILAGCLANDENSKEWLYRSFYGYVKGVVIRYHKEPLQVEELVNDSFIKVFYRLHTFIYSTDSEDLPKLFKGWMARIASRTVIDHLRVAKNHWRFEEINEIHAPVNAVTVLDKMNVSDILSLLNELPQLQQVIFNMYEIEGFKHEETATSLNIPVKHSRVYLARAKERLRALYLNQIKES
ncbi:RNA polymerase sigma factor (sigma-70 family) [Mucilaginibacter sp. UYP25]|uniref:RNA polymerase sigma factor n=1 Tax=unclassified Mucilaginibacter TaxID=2617802 RepID=UPI0033936E40